VYSGGGGGGGERGAALSRRPGYMRGQHHQKLRGVDVAVKWAAAQRVRLSLPENSFILLLLPSF